MSFLGVSEFGSHTEPQRLRPWFRVHGLGVQFRGAGVSDVVFAGAEVSGNGFSVVEFSGVGFSGVRISSVGFWVVGFLGV